MACFGSLANPAFALTRQIYDCGDSVGDTNCYLDLLQGGYFYGRSEGQPPRGPNPLNITTPNGGNLFGSTDVDTLYDLTGQIHQYYTTVLGRNGPNGLGGTGNGTTVPSDVYRVFANGDFSSIGELCNVPQGSPSAGASTTSCVVCKGSATPDIFGHEMAHVLARYSANLGGTNEAGTLNEAMGDFFGEAFERYLTGDNDWIIGTGHALPNRSMSDPPTIAQGPFASPDRYLHPDFYTGPLDAGGVHINAGVLNKAAYLAVEGGAFNGYTVTGIGFEKVEQIWFRALTEYFEPTETFNDAYFDIIQATDDLYSSFEVTQITSALRAVEMHLSRNVPEPASLMLCVVGGLALMFGRSARNAGSREW